MKKIASKYNQEELPNFMERIFYFGDKINFFPKIFLFRIVSLLHTLVKYDTLDNFKIIEFDSYLKVKLRNIRIKLN